MTGQHWVEFLLPHAASGIVDSRLQQIPERSIQSVLEWLPPQSVRFRFFDMQVQDSVRPPGSLVHYRQPPAQPKATMVNQSAWYNMKGEELADGTEAKMTEIKPETTQIK